MTKKSSHFIHMKGQTPIPKGTMEDFKRPNHPDFMDTSELRKLKFSGIRHNSLTDEAEIWVLGNIEERITKAQIHINPLALNEAMEKAFALHKAMPDTQEAKSFIQQQQAIERGKK